MGLISNGTTLLDAGAIDSGITQGSMTLINTLTASSSANLTFSSGITSAYKEYVFHLINIHPATDTADLFIKFRDGSTAYDATHNATVWRAYHGENNTSSALEYEASEDVSQGTSGQGIAYNIGNDNDQSTSGYFHLFNPASTVFHKHFLCRMQNSHGSDLALDNYVAGYCNVTAAIDGIQFVMDSGNIDSGTIKMYGVS
tara:strand:- start:665 stop:1264 length:600 start_codon:yes stop_codon:yes gene_type:complete